MQGIGQYELGTLPDYVLKALYASKLADSHAYMEREMRRRCGEHRLLKNEQAHKLITVRMTKDWLTGCVNTADRHDLRHTWVPAHFCAGETVQRAAGNAATRQLRLLATSNPTEGTLDREDELEGLVSGDRTISNDMTDLLRGGERFLAAVETFFPSPGHPLRLGAEQLDNTGPHDMD